MTCGQHSRFQSVAFQGLPLRVRTWCVLCVSLELRLAWRRCSRVSSYYVETDTLSSFGTASKSLNRSRILRGPLSGDKLI